MKFRFYIVDGSGLVTGTNSEKAAQAAVTPYPEYGDPVSVIDTETGRDLAGDYEISENQDFVL